MRRLLNLVIQASVIAYDVNMCEKTLIYGRNNTFLLSVTDNLLQIVLRVTESDGPGAGDLTLLRVMILN